VQSPEFNSQHYKRRRRRGDGEGEKRKGPGGRRGKGRKRRRKKKKGMERNHASLCSVCYGPGFRMP
jgi:hypothetical protein